jgi:peroxiredoxin (alkyl hydroperoxide reductase subunit C)
MTIAPGDRIPNATLFVLGEDGGPKAVSADEIFKGRRVALFGVPGAFTRTCSARHLPGFVAQADALKARGIDEVVCLAVNDAAVMSAWGQQHGAADKVLMVGDGRLEFTRGAGLEVDMSARGYGHRCRRFSMIVDDGRVTHMHLEKDGGFGETSAETLLADL